MFEKNVSLLPYNTFGIDAHSKLFVRFSSVEELKKILSERKNEELLVLGGGSNILLLSDFEGLTIRNEIRGIDIVQEDDKQVVVKVGAGEVWHEFVLHTLQNNWGGVENLSLIPGSVGASPMQNIGAYGVEIKDVFVELDAVHIATQKVRTFSHEECEFGYRESVFKRSLKGKYIITSVTYKLSKQPVINTKYGAISSELNKMKVSSPTIHDVSKAVIQIRQSKLPDPKEIGNGGSFFKNPIIKKEVFSSLQKEHPEIPFYPVDEKNVKVPAGWLIDQSGWKGKTFGTYGVHKKQALVLVNYGGSTGKDIYDLSEKIIENVKENYGIQLEREVNIV